MNDPSEASIIRKVVKKPKLDFQQEVDEYKKFAFEKDFMQMAVALVMATAVQQVVTTISNGILMPVLNYIINGVGTNWRTMELTLVPGCTLETGPFLGALVNFLVISVTMYFIYVKIIKNLAAPETPPDESSET